jgi:hypothetical protein
MKNKDTYNKGVAKDQEKHTGEQGEFFTFDGTDNIGVTDMFVDDGFDIIHQHRGNVHLSDLSPEESETAIPQGTKKVKKVVNKPNLSKAPFNVGLNEGLRQTKNINPKLMVGDEITVLDIDEKFKNTKYSPQLFKDYVVVGVRYRQRENWEGPDADTSYYHIEPTGMADDEFLDSPLTLHASDKWIRTNDISLNESLRQTKNLNPDLMIGDEIMVVSTEGIHDFGTPELFKPYLVIGIKYNHNTSDPNRKNNRPDYDKPFYQIEPLGMTDDERTGAMLAGGGRARPLYIFSPDDGHTGSDQWILRPGFLRGELEEEGETNEAARTLSKARKAGVDTYYPKSAVKANPERFRKYTRDKYLNEYNQPGLNPVLKVDDIVRVIDVDGEHGRMPERFKTYRVVRVGNAYPLMTMRNRGYDTYYDMVDYPSSSTQFSELDVKSLYRGDTWIYADVPMTNKVDRKTINEHGADTSWANDDDKVTLQDILELTKDIPIISYPTKELAKLPSLKKIVSGWNPEEIERISQVDVSRQYPILVMVNEYNEVQWILDGNHRAQQAVMNNIPTIPAKLIKPSDLDERSIKMFYPEGIPGTNQTINEDKESINNMVYIEKPRKKHLQKMGNTLGNFKEFNWEKFKNTPPPKNDSKATEDEIKEVQKIKVNKKFVDTTDDIHEHFEDFLKTKDIEYPKKEVNKSMKGLSRIIIELKYHYNRPRPGQIAEKKKIKLKPTTLDTVSTPAYPSGHALRGRFIGRYLSEKYPKYKKELMKLGDEVGDGRLMAKVHYPSDNKFGKKIGDELYNHYTTKYKKMVSEQVDSEEPDTNNQPLTRKDVIILNYLSKKYTLDELRNLWEDEPYGKEKEKWKDHMKLFGIYADQGTQPDNFIRSTQYARWAWDNWEEAKKYDMDFGKIPNPLKIPLKWYEVEKEETGSQVEYRRGDAEVLAFDEDNAGERADYDFYAWGGDMETYDYGDYESYDSDITSTEFIRMDESVSRITPDKNPQTQELLFNFWQKVGPTMETDKLKLIGFDMNDNQDMSTVSMNLLEYYGDEEIIEIITERLEGIQGWEYEYVVTNIDMHDLINPNMTYPPTIMIDVVVDGKQEVPVSTEDGIEEMTLWEANERARKEWKRTGPGPYDNVYEEVREQVLSDLSILLKNMPIEPMLDYVEFSEPNDSIDVYLEKIEIIEDLKNWSYDGKKVGPVKEQVMMKTGDMLKSDIFKFLSNRFSLTPAESGEIKDHEGNYYRLTDIEEPEDYVTLSHLIDPVVEFIDYGIKSGTFEEGDIHQGIKSITDWISLEMNQKKDLPN